MENKKNTQQGFCSGAQKAAPAEKQRTAQLKIRLGDI